MKPDLKSQAIRDEQGNLLHYVKVCPHCHKSYNTTARSQKFCSDSCRVKYNKRVKASKERYSKVKEIERIRVRAHSFATAVMDQLVQMGVIEKKCAHCGSTEKLHIHHIDKFNWLDNTPRNLIYLCEKCHTKEHSRVEAELNEEGILLSEWYEKSMEPFYKVLNKNSNGE